MSDSENDEELKKAIALSLGETLSPVPIHEKNVVDLTTSTAAMSDSEYDEDLKKAIALSKSPTILDPESDEDLKRAIALSSREALSPAPINEKVVDLTLSDEDGDDLDAPVATHFKFSQTNPVLNTSTNAEPSTSSQISSQPNSTLFNGMTRKQMEEERLARIEQRSKEPNAISKKRKASLSSPTTSPSDRHQPKVSRSGPIPHQMTVKNRQVESTTRNSAGNGPNYTLDQSSSLREPDSEIDIEAAIIPGKLHRSLKSQGDISETGIQFPLGVVKKTWAQGFPREDDIKIEEVLQSSTLEHAILGAFQIDSDWIRSKIQPSTKVIWVLQAKTEAEKMNFKSLAPETYRFCFPPMEGNVNIMHSKLQILAHPTHLRLVIPSANLTPYDWGESGGILENVVFLIDLPRLPNGEKASDDQLTPFAQDLLHFLHAMTLTPRTIESLKRFDFSNTKHLAFVHSIGGSHFGTNLQRTGYPGLGSCVRSLGLDTDHPLEIEYVTASIGNLDDRFLRTMYLASQGDNGSKEYKWRTEKPARSKMETVMETQLSEEIGRRFRVYFPRLLARFAFDQNGTMQVLFQGSSCAIVKVAERDY
ncbi:ubiquitin interaction domain-containing protein [Botrytis cinerea]